MLGRLYEGEICSAAWALEIVGERWSLLIIRDALFKGVTRFSEFQRGLGIAPNILAKRLEAFVAEGIFEMRGGDAEHQEYVLTRKGADLMPVIIALSAWTDRWAAPNGAPIVYKHKECGGRVTQALQCSKCGEALRPADVFARLTKAAERSR
jgi:DNA-binding HxlR family transcriptional regulator